MGKSFSRFKKNKNTIIKAIYWEVSLSPQCHSPSSSTSHPPTPYKYSIVFLCKWKSIFYSCYTNSSILYAYCFAYFSTFFDHDPIARNILHHNILHIHINKTRSFRNQYFSLLCIIPSLLFSPLFLFYLMLVTIHKIDFIISLMGIIICGSIFASARCNVNIC